MFSMIFKLLILTKTSNKSQKGSHSLPEWKVLRCSATW